MYQPVSFKRLSRSAPRCLGSAATIARYGLILIGALAGCAPQPTPVPILRATEPPITTPQIVIAGDSTLTATPTRPLASQTPETINQSERGPNFSATPTATETEPLITVTPTPTAGSFFQQHVTNLFDLSNLPVWENSIATQFTSRNWVSLEHFFDYFIDDGNFIGPNYGYVDEQGVRQPYRIVAGYNGGKEYEIVPRTQGPGEIVRIWFAYQQHESLNNPNDMSQVVEWNNWGNLGEMGNIRFYFDDETIPRIDVGIKDIFVGKGPFPAPLAAFYASADGGNINYVPIPFQKSIRVTTTGRPRLMQVQVKRFVTPAPTPVAPLARLVSGEQSDPPNHANSLQSFSLNISASEQAALDQGVQVWQTCTPVLTGKERTFPLTIPPLSSAEVNFNQPATISGIRVVVPKGREESTWMQVFWDGNKDPGMIAPLRAMFGAMERLLPYSALPMGTELDKDQLVFYNNIPMPFQTARFVFVNDSTDPLPLTFSAATRDTVPGSENMRLHAFFGTRRMERRVDEKDNYVIIDVKGSGKYLGTIFSAWDLDRAALNGPLDDHWRFPYLESNMDVWVDGRLALPGTGIEDDFNASYYYVFAGYPSYKTTYCLAGMTLLDYNTILEPSSQYRFYLNDAPEFRNDLRVEVQHGNKGNNLTVTYSSTAFWYQAP